MAYKSRPGGWIVEVDICKKCHYIKKYCICKKEEVKDKKENK